VATRFGLSLPVVQQIPGRSGAWEAAAGADAILATVVAAERLGFSHVSACDHVAIPQTAAAGTVWYDAAVTLAFVASATRHIRLLSHVVVLPYRHPLLIAKMFATLDRLSNGRVILGAGVGHLQSEFRALAVRFEDRGAIGDEYLQAIQAAWESAAASFSGRFVAFHNVSVAPRPHQQPRPPIWVGGNSARRAGRFGDGWIPWSIGPGEFATLAANARQARAARGRREVPFECVAPLAVGLDDTAAEISARVATWLEAGATWFHVGSAHRSLEHLLERMAAFADACRLESPA